MKNLLLLFFVIFFSAKSQSEILISFPVLKQCKKTQTIEETKQCFNSYLNALLKEGISYKELKIKLPDSIKVFEIKIEVDKKGRVSFASINIENLVLEKKVSNVLSKIPKMKPSIENNKATEVMLIMSIDFSEEEASVLTTLYRPPVFKGCESDFSLKCMREKIDMLIANNFNTEIAYKYDVPDVKITIYVLFKVDEKGEVVRVRALIKNGMLDKIGNQAKIALEEEAVRVVEMLPTFKPGVVENKFVRVPYMVPIMFKVN